MVIFSSVFRYERERFFKFSETEMMNKYYFVQHFMHNIFHVMLSIIGYEYKVFLFIQKNAFD